MPLRLKTDGVHLQSQLGYNKSAPSNIDFGGTKVFQTNRMRTKTTMTALKKGKKSIQLEKNDLLIKIDTRTQGKQCK